MKSGMSGPRAGEFRVLHVADSQSGGGAEQVFRQTVQLTKQINRVVVDTYVGDGRRSPLSYVFSWRHFARVGRRISEFNPDVIHAQNFYHCLSPSILMAVRAARRRGWPGQLVVTAHDYHLAYPNSGFQRFRKGVAENLPAGPARLGFFTSYDGRSRLHSVLKFLQFVLAYRILGLRREIDICITPSEFVAGILRDAGLARVDVVRNPVVGSFARASWRGSAGPGTSLAMVGRLVPEKGFAEAIQAIDRLAGRGLIPLPVRVDVFGAGPEDARLRGLDESCRNVAVTVQGHLAVEELSAALSSASALVAPSRWYEVSPLVLVEAGALGLPVVASDWGGIAETAMLSARASLFRVDDDESLGTAIGQVLGSREANTLLEPSAFTEDAYVRDLMAVYGLSAEDFASGELA